MTRRDMPPVEALVLTQNERSAIDKGWEDETGKRWHFPNTQRRKVIPGTPFVYYRGVRRARRRATPEYFGHGVIGTVYEDERQPSTTPPDQRKWFCDIDDFQAFQRPVPWRRPDGSLLESREKQQSFQTPARPISVEVFDEILTLAGVTDRRPPESLRDMPNVVAIDEASHLALLIGREGGCAGGRLGWRQSRKARRIGERGEEIVFEYLKRRLPAIAKLHWCSRAGETPGWDMEYRDGDRRIAVEVKSTTLPTFSCFEFTLGEWRAASDLRRSYWLYLVANCMTQRPVIASLQDPIGVLETSALRAEPASWRFFPAYP